MLTIETTLTTQAVFNDDETKRYLLKKVWDTSLPSLTICMLSPSIASGIELDAITSLVLNNASALGFGSVSIVNLFATLDNPFLCEPEEEDPENLEVIVGACRNADVVIYSPGVGKANLQQFQNRAKQVLEALRPFEKKLRCLTNGTGKARFLHPLCPSVRVWGKLAEFSVSELLPNNNPIALTSQPKKKGKPIVLKKEVSA